MIRLVLLSPLLLLAGCTCNGDDPNACPKEFKVGDPCKIEGQKCLYPGTKCGLANCTCKNQPGGFNWECESGGECLCVCPCGRLAVGSCEALECSKPQDPCPATLWVQTLCSQGVCMDLGLPDRGREAGKKDGPADGPQLDAAKDAAKDAPGVDAPADRGADAPSDTGGPDAPADLPGGS